MKDQLLFRSQKKKSKYFLYFLILFFIIIISFSIFKKEVFNISIDLTLAKEKIQILFQNKNNLLIKNKRLLGHISELENSKNILDFYKIENKKLKLKLSYQDIYKEKRFHFNVYSSKDSEFFNHFVLLDKDKKTSIGDLVFSKYNILIGFIKEKIKNDKVIVDLYSNNNNENLFFIMDGGEKILKVKAIGQGSGILKVEAPRGISFKNKNKVFLVDTRNPSYLVAVKVDEIFEVQNPNTVLYFKMLVNPYLLSEVEILHLENDIKK